MPTSRTVETGGYNSDRIVEGPGSAKHPRVTQFQVKPEQEATLAAANILIAAPEALFREAFCSLLRMLSGQSTLWPVADLAGLRLVDPAQRRRIDLALVHVRAARIDDDAVLAQADALRDLLERSPIVYLVDSIDTAGVMAGLKHGIRGFVPTSIQPRALLHALNFIQAGGTFVPDCVLAGDLAPDPTGFVANDRSALMPAADEARISFTPRQNQVLDLLRRGLQNKIIAYELGMKESTVKIHIRHIMRKLGVHSRTQVALYAEQMARASGRYDAS